MCLFFLTTDSVLSNPSMVLALKILIDCSKKDIYFGGWGWFHNQLHQEPMVTRYLSI